MTRSLQELLKQFEFFPPVSFPALWIIVANETKKTWLCPAPCHMSAPQVPHSSAPCLSLPGYRKLPLQVLGVVNSWTFEKDFAFAILLLAPWSISTFPFPSLFILIYNRACSLTDLSTLTMVKTPSQASAPLWYFYTHKIHNTFYLSLLFLAM